MTLDTRIRRHQGIHKTSGTLHGRQWDPTFKRMFVVAAIVSNIPRKEFSRTNSSTVHCMPSAAALVCKESGMASHENAIVLACSLCHVRATRKFSSWVDSAGVGGVIVSGQQTPTFSPMSRRRSHKRTINRTQLDPMLTRDRLLRRPQKQLGLRWIVVRD